MDRDDTRIIETAGLNGGIVLAEDEFPAPDYGVGACLAGRPAAEDILAHGPSWMRANRCTRPSGHRGDHIYHSHWLSGVDVPNTWQQTYRGVGRLRWLNRDSPRMSWMETERDEIY